MTPLFESIPSQMPKKLFITGTTGYIGGTILHELVRNHKADYEITALVRTEASAAKVKAAGAFVILGSYDQPELLVKAAQTSDVIIHTGDSADHAGSTKAIFEGISQRSTSSAPVIYIHTSGTGVISDPHHGDVEGKKIYDDLKPEDIDALDPNQPHRKVDIFVRDNAKELQGKSKTAIIIPPNIYGVGTGPVNQISIQTPTLIRFALKHKFAPRIGAGVNWWNNVHVKDLARGYVFLLNELERTSETGWNGYWFAETEEHQWKDIYATLGKVMHAKGFVDSPEPASPAARLGSKSDYEAISADSGEIYDSWGSNSRGRASRLRALGWKKEEKEDVLASIDTEVDAIANKHLK